MESRKGVLSKSISSNRGIYRRTRPGWKRGSLSSGRTSKKKEAGGSRRVAGKKDSSLSEREKILEGSIRKRAGKKGRSTIHEQGGALRRESSFWGKKSMIKQLGLKEIEKINSLAKKGGVEKS